MNQADAPGPRIDAAKTAARGLVDALPDDATVGLETYGMGTGSTESEHDAGCQDVQRVIALGPLNRDEMRAHVDGLNASGYTPIGLALDRAAAQLPADDSAQAIVLVSDGEDTCDSAPCDRASQIKHTHPQLVISTVGFKTDGPASDQLKCIAAATGGIFVQAANASQLAARLIATQDPGQAQTALTSNGIGDIELGANVADIRTKHSDFPDAGTTGRITVVWRDCDYDFTDGTLDAIRPRNGGRTIDGLTVGSPLSKATELYGGPLSTTPNSGGTTTVTYDADPNTDAAYQMVIDGYTSAGTNNPSNGTVETIVLCRCKPQSGPIAKPTALSPTSNNLVYIKAKSGDTWCMIMSSEVDCGARYTNPPELYGQPANGFRFRADGTSEWVVGNFGLVEWQQIDHATYTAIGWTVDSTASGLTFTNDDTGHSVFVSPGRVERVG
ncbi:Ca-activated chloride channel family protein [Mycobacterium sp. BK086]|nr:Ca-activated chloride channel family protein [Mycobacterium sp. BK086]